MSESVFGIIQRETEMLGGLIMDIRDMEPKFWAIIVAFVCLVLGGSLYAYNVFIDDYGSVNPFKMGDNSKEYHEVSSTFMEKLPEYSEETSTDFDNKSVCETYDLLVLGGVMEKSETEFVNRKMCYSSKKDTYRIINKTESGYQVTPDFDID